MSRLYTSPDGSAYAETDGAHVAFVRECNRGCEPDIVKIPRDAVLVIAEKLGSWVECSERMPELNGHGFSDDVLVARHGNAAIAHVTRDGRWFYMDRRQEQIAFEPTHWRPTPPLPANTKPARCATCRGTRRVMNDPPTVPCYHCRPCPSCTGDAKGGG